PLTHLEEMKDAALAALVEKMKKKSKLRVATDEHEKGEKEDGEAEGDEDEEQEEEAEEEQQEEDEESGSSPSMISESSLAEDSDESRIWRDRASTWARRAVKAGKLVPKPRGK